MASRAADGRSTIIPDTSRPGRWRGKVSMGVGHDGRPVTRYVRGATKSAVAKKVKELERQREAGLLADTTNVTVADHLDAWINGRERRNEVRPLTIKGYRTDARNVRAAIGGVRLSQLGPRHINQVWAYLLGRGLSVDHCRRTLNAVLNDAVRLEFITANPVGRAGRPKRPKPRMVPYSIEQMHAYLYAARAERNRPRWTLAVVLGLRQGEALGIQWGDLDLDEPMRPAVLTIHRQLQRVPYHHGCGDPKNCIYVGTDGQVHPTKRAAECPAHTEGGLVWPEPKSEAGKRLLVLVEPIRQELLAHRDRQAEEAKTNPLWCYGPGGGWVFTQPDGGPVDPRQDNRDFKRLMAAAGIPEKRLHDLRHSAATMMRGVGLDLVGAGEVLGQSSTAQTAEYTHVLDDHRVRAARLVGEASFGTQTQPKKPRKARKRTGE